MYKCVILVNWNGWKDTVECLESVFRLRCADFRIVVCDNGSTDGSLEKIEEWARGNFLAEVSDQRLWRLSSPPFTKPIPFRKLTREQAASGATGSDPRLILIQNGANLGFAAGNNVGLRYALGDVECKFFWLLNNDTVVDPEALSAMILHVQEHPEIGLCGSLNLSYYKPDEVQAQGGRQYSVWTGRARMAAACKVEALDPHSVRMDYVNGASMLATRAFLEGIGLLEESYFLYFEEMDWALRAKGVFQLGYVRDSIVYHKEGATTGSSTDQKKRSLLSEKYASRNRVLFTKRFFPWALPSVLVWTWLAAAHRLCWGDRERAKEMFLWSLKGLIAKRRCLR